MKTVENKNVQFRSEPELGEEPPVLAGFETILEALLGLLEGSDLLVLGVEDVGGDGVLEVHVERVARWHQVLVVDELDEGLHARLLRGLLGGVLLYDLARVLLYPCNQTVTVGALARALIEGSHYHRLLPRVTPLQHYHCFVRLQKLHHFCASFSLSLCAVSLTVNLKTRTNEGLLTYNVETLEGSGWAVLARVFKMGLFSYTPIFCSPIFSYIQPFLFAYK